MKRARKAAAIKQMPLLCRYSRAKVNKWVPKSWVPGGGLGLMAPAHKEENGKGEKVTCKAEIELLS